MFESEILNYFSHLIGLTMGEIKEDDIEVGYWISAFVPLIGSQITDGVDVHFGWTTEKEVLSGEILGESPVPGFNEFVAGSKIISIVAGAIDRDDEVYLYAKTDSGNELEIPLGFNPVKMEFHGYFKEILSDEKQAWFIENYFDVDLE